MKVPFAVALVAAVAVAGCASSRPPASDATVRNHVLAITYCYARAFYDAHGVESAVDKHAVRTCFNKTANDPPQMADKMSDAMLAIGRTCESTLDPASDDAVVAYRTCVFEKVDKL